MKLQKQIMIIDDRTENLKLLESILMDEGYNVYCFPRGDLALNSKVLPKMDLIFLDVNMPVMSGYEVCKELKKDSMTKEIPVIFLSALHDTFDKVKGFKVGAVDFVTKPYEIEELRARMKTHLKIYELESELREINGNLEEILREKVEEITQAKLSTIFALADISESRDADIGNHIERVHVLYNYLSKMLLKQGLFSHDIAQSHLDQLSDGALLHDIGMIGIEDEILKKPGKLTSEEFDRMKEHTIIGSNILKRVLNKYPNNKVIKIGAIIAKSHHERWDGTGYPDQLKGEEIPLLARIMTLVDVYDALRSKRVYKEPMDHETALEIIKNDSGKLFDPTIVDVFLHHAENFRKIFDTIG